jgi:predicted transcriptional regulator
LHYFYKGYIIVLHEKSQKKVSIMSTHTLMRIDGQKLKRLRERRLWLINDLAEKSGVHRNLISTYEHGKSGAHPDTIRKLASALEVDPAELVPDEE